MASEYRTTEGLPSLDYDTLHNKYNWTVGFYFLLGSHVRWDISDPPELVKVGLWIAGQEDKFKGSYRTTRKDCGFAIVFSNSHDADLLEGWLKSDRAIENEAVARARLGRRRNKYQQLPGDGDRAWSAGFTKSVLKELRVLSWSPFSSDDQGHLYMPVARLRAFQLNW